MSIHNGMILVTPSSVNRTGTSATINASGSVSFTACSVLSLNGVFSSTYDNYIIDIRFLGTVFGAALRIRMRSTGTDNATVNAYARQYVIADSTSVSGERSSDTFANISFANNTREGLNLFLYGPNLSQPTAGRSVTVSGSNNAYIYDSAFTHNQSTSYDGFTFIPSSGNVTGLVKVYGLRQ